MRGGLRSGEPAGVIANWEPADDVGGCSSFFCWNCVEVGNEARWFGAGESASPPCRSAAAAPSSAWAPWQEADERQACRARMSRRLCHPCRSTTSPHRDQVELLGRVEGHDLVVWVREDSVVGERRQIQRAALHRLMAFPVHGTNGPLFHGLQLFPVNGTNAACCLSLNICLLGV